MRPVSYTHLDVYKRQSYRRVVYAEGRFLYKTADRVVLVLDSAEFKTVFVVPYLLREKSLSLIHI